MYRYDVRAVTFSPVECVTCGVDISPSPPDHPVFLFKKFNLMTEESTEQVKEGRSASNLKH